jgi:hypothetical protein
MDEVDSSIAWLNSPENYIVKDRRLVSLFTQTGGISVHHVNTYIGLNNSSVVDSEPDGLADDPYRFGETGEVAP